MKEKSKFKVSNIQIGVWLHSIINWVNQTQVIKDDIWPNPLQYFFSPDVDCDANGMPIDDDDDDDDDGR